MFPIFSWSSNVYPLIRVDLALHTGVEDKLFQFNCNSIDSNVLFLFQNEYHYKNSNNFNRRNLEKYKDLFYHAKAYINLVLCTMNIYVRMKY